ncbi:MAG: hypothetical protein NVSMB9_16270 [Isosphaeraceae bacterium]
MTGSDSPRSNLSVGMDWASRVTTVGLEFVVPPLLGVFLDGRMGTSPFAMLLGAVCGFALGMFHILRIAREGAGTPKAPPPGTP